MMTMLDASHDVELDAVKPVLPTASENAQHINILPFISWYFPSSSESKASIGYPAGCRPKFLGKNLAI
jgi:hypothetical protein